MGWGMSRGIRKVLGRGAAGAALLALAACASEQRYAEAPGSGYDPRYEGYWSADPRLDDEPGDDDGALPSYLEYPEYYSALWPAYQYAYDPGFYYGVTYFPSAWFGVGYDDPYAWPYYVPYSPYPFSPWDNYYVWYGDSHHGHGHHHHHHDGDHHGHGHDHDGDGYAHDGPRRRHGDPEPAAGDRPRFGSVANEAQRLAEREALERT